MRKEVAEMREIVKSKNAAITELKTILRTNMNNKAVATHYGFP